MNNRHVQVNDVVQISPEVDHHDGFWAGNLLVVTEVFSWGVQGYCRATDGKAFLRLNFQQFEKIGQLVWIEESSEKLD